MSVYVYKISFLTNVAGFRSNFYVKTKRKTVKNFVGACSSDSNYSNQNSPWWELSRGHLSRVSSMLEENYWAAIIWVQFTLLGIL